MALTRASFSPIGGQARRGNAPAVWAYKTEDTAATVDSSGYFNSLSDILEVGDLIYRVTTSGGNVASAGWHIVLSNAAGVVDVGDANALSLSDTD